MGLRVERIPTLGDNYTYLITCEESGESAVIDAPEEGPVVERIEALGAKLTLVLSTHHHWDHSAANPDLAKRYGAPVFGHASDDGRLPGLTNGLEEGDSVHWGDRTAVDFMGGNSSLTPSKISVLTLVIRKRKMPPRDL